MLAFIEPGIRAQMQSSSPTYTSQPNLSGIVPWAFACFFIPFAIILVVTVIAALREGPDKGQSRDNFFARSPIGKWLGLGEYRGPEEKPSETEE